MFTYDSFAVGKRTSTRRLSWVGYIYCNRIFFIADGLSRKNIFGYLTTIVYSLGFVVVVTSLSRDLALAKSNNPIFVFLFCSKFVLDKCSYFFIISLRTNFLVFHSEVIEPNLEFILCDKACVAKIPALVFPLFQSAVIEQFQFFVND